jgi:BASS family bile acid:Na+ symporter
VALLLGIVASLVVSWRDILGAVGTWIFIGTAIVLATGLVAGYLASFGRAPGDRTVAAMATAQRNISAAIVVAVSLGRADAVVLTIVAALVIPIALIVLAGELGRRVSAPGAAAGEGGRAQP